MIKNEVCILCLAVVDKLAVVPLHAVRAYIVSHDIALKHFYPTWRVFTDYLTFGDEDGIESDNRPPFNS